jgi:thiol:disulfide interchange protein DsbC
MMIKPLLLGASFALISQTLWAGEAQEIRQLRQKLVRQFPNTQFGEIKPSASKGIYEVWMGNNVAYLGKDSRYFIFGHMYDMHRMMDLTETAISQVEKSNASDNSQAIDFKSLPFDQAIKMTTGNGSRSLVVFSDPDCPYCHDLEAELAKLDNTTVYVFPYPVETLHPDAIQIAERIWCAADRAASWRTYLSGGVIGDVLCRWQPRDGQHDRRRHQRTL